MVAPKHAVDAALRDSEERLRLMIDSVKDYAIFMLDAEGRVQTWNPGAERVKGYAAQEIIGHHISTFYTEEDRRAGRPAANLARAAEHGRLEDESWRVRKDGSRFWASVVISAVRDSATRELLGFTKVTRDMTAHRAAEETRLSLILQNVADGITVQDERGRLLYANDAAARLCGFASPEEMLKASAEQIVARFATYGEDGHPVSVERLPGRMALRGEKPEPLTVRVIEKASGKEWWSRIRSNAVPASAGRGKMAVNVWHDVTAEKQQQRAERYLAAATEVLSRSLDRERTLQSLAGVLVPELADWCSIQLLENKTLRSVVVHHKDPQQVAFARELSTRYPPDMNAANGAAHVVRTGRSEIYNDLSPAFLGKTARDAEHLRMLTALSLRSAIVVPLGPPEKILGAMTLVRTGAGANYSEVELTLAEEVGRRAGIAVENARLYEEAQAAIRRRDDFLSVASHELRTPLTSLELHISALNAALEKNKPVSTEKLSARVDRAHLQVRRLTKLIEELLDVTRIGSGSLTLTRAELDLSALVLEVCERFEHEGERVGSPLIVDAPRAVNGNWDASRLDQVVTNLLSNALKYGAGQPIELRVEESGGIARLTVRDHGIGVEPADRERIFERFERTAAARNFGGLGLGLWIARRICEAHGGTVCAGEAPGGGASFTVELPTSRPSS